MFVYLCARSTHRITITNFCLGKHLVSEDDLLKDQRGSPAYISPDVLSGEFKTDIYAVLSFTFYVCFIFYTISLKHFEKTSSNVVQMSTLTHE